MRKKRRIYILLSTLFLAEKSRPESGSALLYVLMLTAVGAGTLALVTNRSDQYKTSTKKLEASAFVHDALTNFNRQLSCPGGVIRVKKGTCHENSGVTLSINEIRRHVAEATPHSIATLGVLPPLYRGIDYFNLIHMRIACYKQESPFDRSGQPMMTDQKQQPCVLLKTIDKTLTPYAGASLLSADEDRFLADVQTIERSIVPDIHKKIEAANQEIKRLESLKEATARQLVTALAQVKTAYDSYLLAQNAYVSSVDTYNQYVNVYNQLASACSSG